MPKIGESKIRTAQKSDIFYHLRNLRTLTWTSKNIRNNPRYEIETGLRISENMIDVDQKSSSSILDFLQVQAWLKTPAMTPRDI